MPEALLALVGWVVPAAVVFGVAAIGLTVVVWAIRRSRRSPRARADAAAARDRAGVALVRLDDAVAELDLEVGLSGALYGGDSPSSLRRTRITGQRVRDESFAEYRAASDPDLLPSDVRRTSQRIVTRTEEALALIATARGEHAAWMRANVSAATQIAAARERLAHVSSMMGEPDALVAELSSRFADEEWAAASRSAESARQAIVDARRLLDRAESSTQDPTRTALGELASAEKAMRSAEEETRILEESHRLVTQASLAVPREFESARAAVSAAIATRAGLEPDEAERLGIEIREIDSALTALEADAARRPTKTVDAIARLRDRLDLALGDARTAQQRMRGARSALPGTLAAARGAVARAEAALAGGATGVDARARLLSAHEELAQARQQSDPVEALDAARRALRDAEDAEALAAHDRMTGA